MKRLGMVVTTLFAAGACSSDAPDESTSRAAVVSDAVHGGGREGFYFLPPLVPATELPGTFDSSRSLVARLDTPGGASIAAIALRPTTANYQAMLDTSELGLDSEVVYRLRVMEGSVELGFADVQVFTTSQLAHSLASDDAFELVDGKKLHVKVYVAAAAPSCSDGACASASCFDLTACHDACTTSGCHDACTTAAAPSAVQHYDALRTCETAYCGSITDPVAYASCCEQACSALQMACEPPACLADADCSADGVCVAGDCYAVSDSPSLTPSAGGPGQSVMLIDPQGRMTQATSMMLTPIGESPDRGTFVRDVVYAPDGRFATARIPNTAAGGSHFVTVHRMSTSDPPVFNGVSFDVQ